MGRRRSQADVQKETFQGGEDAEYEAHQRRASALIEFARPIDEHDKALTGRRMEHYQDESGVTKEELFPEEGHILNIGDPWQKLDRKGITTLEYETGDEASFITDEETFFHVLPSIYEVILDEITYLSSIDPEIAHSLSWKVKALQEFSLQVSLEDYPKQASLAQEIVKEIGSLSPKVYDRYPNAWYSAIHIARGYNDLFLEKKVIQPTLQKEIIARKGLTNDEIKDIRRQIIERYRGGKRYHDAELVKGAFPHTDFDDHSFERITASWSISAHMFGVMDAGHFATIWNEVDRLLKRDGMAYFWPPNYHCVDPSELLKSLHEYVHSGGVAGFIMHNDSGFQRIIWLDDRTDDDVMHNWMSVMTLFVGSRRNTKKVKMRVEQGLL